MKEVLVKNGVSRPGTKNAGFRRSPGRCQSPHKHSFAPAVFFPATPDLVVIPETYVYVAPDVRDDMFFYGGWWWRHWEGRWYRSHHHDRGCVCYRRRKSGDPFWVCRMSE